MQESSIDRAQKKILRISIIATIVLLASVVWVNYERNIAPGDKTLTFEKEPIFNAFKEIEKNYKCEVLVKGTELSDCLLTVKFTDKTLEEIMRTLEFRYKFNLEKVTKRKYVVSGGECSN